MLAMVCLFLFHTMHIFAYKLCDVTIVVKILDSMRRIPELDGFFFLLWYAVDNCNDKKVNGNNISNIDINL